MLYTLRVEGTIFYDGNGHYYRTFEQDDNVKALNVENGNSKDTSECHFKCQNTRPKPMYYDKANFHPLDADVLFVDVLTSTQPMKLGGGEVIWFFVCLFVYFFFALILTKINI